METCVNNHRLYIYTVLHKVPWGPKNEPSNVEGPPNTPKLASGFIAAISSSPMLLWHSNGTGSGFGEVVAGCVVRRWASQVSRCSPSLCSTWNLCRHSLPSAGDLIPELQVILDGIVIPKIDWGWLIFGNIGCHCSSYNAFRRSYGCCTMSSE